MVTLSQALACTWFLLHRVLVPPNGFHKNQKKVWASDGHGRCEVSKFNKNSDFCGIRRSKFAFSCIIQPIFFENEKRNTLIMFLTHIFAFKVAILFSESPFCPKRAKIQAQISWERVGTLGKNFTRCQMSSFSTKQLKTKKIWRHHLQALPYFAWISQKTALKIWRNLPKLYMDFAALSLKC